MRCISCSINTTCENWLHVKMPFSEDDRVLIKELRVAKGYGARRFLQEFPHKNWSLTALNRLIKNITATGSAKRMPGSGRPRSARTSTNIAAVEELVLSQDDQPGTHQSVREIARETGMNRESIRNIIRKDLQLKPLKRKRAHELTAANKLTRLVRCKQLLRQFPKHMTNFIWFTDEKVFTVAAPVNPQNDRLYVTAGMRKSAVSAERLLRTRPTFSKSVMVSVGVSSLGCTELVFVEPGVKINGAYYRDVLLSQHLLPAIKEQSSGYFVFQQDSAPAHRAHETVALLRRETPSFIAPTLWPPNSPDLNPVDYKIWSVLQERVYRSRIRDVEHLKLRLIEEWSRFEQRIIDGSVSEWRRRLQACVRSEGGHFEHQL
jgi:inhibitor of nuclear factor kappa-B kinase subunit alpha